MKVLWHFHAGMTSKENTESPVGELQLQKLWTLNKVCATLSRKLMVKLIIPNDFNENGNPLSAGKTLGEAMAKVYQAGINPFWWKINALDNEEEWQIMTGLLDKYDPEVGVIILGNNAPHRAV